MVEVVNAVSGLELRGRVKKDLKTIPHGWVEFYDDVTGNVIKQAQELQDNHNWERFTEFIVNQIADWNLGDEHGKLLPIKAESILKLPSRVITEISQYQAEILTSQKSDSQKKNS